MRKKGVDQGLTIVNELHAQEIIFPKRLMTWRMKDGTGLHLHYVRHEGGEDQTQAGGEDQAIFRGEIVTSAGQSFKLLKSGVRYEAPPTVEQDEKEGTPDSPTMIAKNIREDDINISEDEIFILNPQHSTQIFSVELRSGDVMEVTLQFLKWL